MFVRFATVASLALLCACGTKEEPAAAKSSSSTSSSTASKTEPAKTEPSKVTPAYPKAADKSTLPDTTKPANSSTASKTATTPTTPEAATAKPITPPASVPPTAPTAKTTPVAPPAAPKPMPDSDNGPGIVSTTPTDVAPGTSTSKLVERAVAHVTATDGSLVSGTISFRRIATGLEVHVVLDGLKAGDHGLHVHEKGDCSGMNAMTAGDHFNPGNAPHGGRESAQRHAGDFGNVTADAAGHVDATFTDSHVALSGETSILGRAIVVHADKDDGMTQPSGNSGDRIACGVIEEDKGTTAGG